MGIAPRFYESEVKADERLRVIRYHHQPFASDRGHFGIYEEEVKRTAV